MSSSATTAAEIVKSAPYRGYEYDDVVSGEKKGTTMSFVRLQSTNETRFDEHAAIILQHVQNTLNDIEEKSKRKIETYYIGKTMCQKSKNYRDNIDTNNCVLKHRIKGFNSRWSSNHSKNYDGMIGIACIVRGHTPKNADSENPIMNQEQYALALETRTIVSLMLQYRDNRLANKGYSPGKKAKATHVAGVLYLAFKLENTPIENIDNEE